MPIRRFRALGNEREPNRTLISALEELERAKKISSRKSCRFDTVWKIRALRVFATRKQANSRQNNFDCYFI
jgi:hypothetical protein